MAESQYQGNVAIFHPDSLFPSLSNKLKAFHAKDFGMNYYLYQDRDVLVDGEQWHLHPMARLERLPPEPYIFQIIDLLQAGVVFNSWVWIESATECQLFGMLPVDEQQGRWIHIGSWFKYPEQAGQMMQAKRGKTHKRW